MTRFEVSARARGFTVIELLATLALLAILLGLAAPSFIAMNTNNQLSSTSSDLMADIMQARAQAMKLNRTVLVLPLASEDWTAGWRTHIELSANESFDSSTDTLVVERPSAESTISQDSSSNCKGLAFQPTGFLGQYDGVLGNCRVVFQATSTGRLKHVVIDRSGRVYICDPSTHSGSCS